MTLDPGYVINGLVRRGMPEHIAIAFAGNGMQESRLNPGINEIAPVVPGSRGGFGLMQWTGPRRRQYEAFAAERGASLDDADTQLDFLMLELGSTEAGAWKAIQTAQTPEEAARLVSEKFLRPGTPHLENRLKFTREFAGMAQPDYARGAMGGSYGGKSTEGLPTQSDYAGGAFSGTYAPQNALAYAGRSQQPQNALAFEWNTSQLDPAAFRWERNALARQPINFGGTYGA